MLSPGAIRKLTSASALPGNTFSLDPALNTVSAVVVRMSAFAPPDCARTEVASGFVSQRLDRTTVQRHFRRKTVPGLTRDAVQPRRHRIGLQLFPRRRRPCR